MIHVAAFDVDGTLTRRDCVVPFLRRVGGTVPVGLDLLRHVHRLLPAVVRRDRDALKAMAAHAAFRGRSAVDVEKQASEFAELVRAHWMRTDTMELLTRHLAAGDAVVLVSASFEVYLRPLAQHLAEPGHPIDVLATGLATQADGTLSGRLDGPNCRGPEKVRRLHGWLDEHHGGRAAVHVTAYGDSTGDRELLLDADVARWVGSRATPDWFPASAP